MSSTMLPEAPIKRVQLSELGGLSSVPKLLENFENKMASDLKNSAYSKN